MRRIATLGLTLALLTLAPACSKCSVPTFGLGWADGMMACTEKGR